VSDVASTAASPDGRRVVYSRRVQENGESPALVANVVGGAQRCRRVLGLVCKHARRFFDATGATILGVGIGVVVAGMFMLATTVVAGQTATGIHLVDVRFRGNTRLETVDQRKCAADLKSRTYEDPEWLAYIAERVRLQCFQDKSYLKAVVEPSTKQLPDNQGLISSLSHSTSMRGRNIALAKLTSGAIVSLLPRNFALCLS
jgi:hypothetical protein